MEPEKDPWVREAERRRFLARIRLAVAMEDDIDTSNWGESEDPEQRRIDWDATTPIEEHASELQRRGVDPDSPDR